MSPLREVWSSFMWCGQGCKARKTHSVVCLQRPGVSREDRNSLAVMEKDLFISWNNANFRCVLFLRFKVYPDEAFMTRVLLLHTSGHLIKGSFYTNNLTQILRWGKNRHRWVSGFHTITVYRYKTNVDMFRSFDFDEKY